MSQIYLKNKDLLEEIMISKKQDKLTKEAEKMFVLLANRTIKKLRYSNPMDKEDCVQTGLLILFTNWRSFDIEKGVNPFSFYTEVLKRGFAKQFNELHKLRGDPNNTVKTISLQSSNEGDGMYNL